MTDKEKLEKIKKLSDAMYLAAQYLTTDASRLHKAMEEYHQFIINEYYKEEPVSESFDTLDQLLAKYAIDFSYKGKTLKECSDKYKDEIIATVNHLKPTSEDLEDAAEKYRWSIEEHCSINDNGTYNYSADDIENSFKTGFQLHKEHMMSKAVDAIPCSILGKEIIYTDLPKEIEIGDEVKVIIIKEE